MVKMTEEDPTFNLWAQPWITLEHSDGGTERLGIEQALLRAHEFASIYEPSPLVVVGIHRLLTAILQAAMNPQKRADLRGILRAGQFSSESIAEFGRRYSERFDLFSSEAPFLQSADLPLQPDKSDKVKTVAYLAMDRASGSAVTHYQHGGEGTHVFCPVCAAGGLAAIPAFATSGGAGIKPSINGVPPIYVLPGSRSLFESLALSLVLPEWQPRVASRVGDTPWWEHPPIVERSKEVRQVGYLHSLTFPARRVRLHPVRHESACSRCGQESDWGIRTMVFEMGESRPKDTETWFDPFAAYRMPESKSGKLPVPIRPTAGKALWREFASLFLKTPAAEGKRRTVPPAVLNQMALLEMEMDSPAYPFRCIGLRTDMKAKVFEWIDTGFDVPLSFLRDEAAGVTVEQAIEFATQCVGILTGVFRDEFGKSKKQERHRTIKTRMEGEYWTALAAPFRPFVLEVASASPADRDAILRRWADTIVREALAAFKRAADTLGDDAATLRERVAGERLCAIRLTIHRNNRFPTEGGSE